MSFAAVAITSAAIGAGSGFLANSLMGDSQLEGVNVPKYFEEPDVQAMQDILKELGPNLLKGDVPSYYAPIGESGGTEFEKYLNSVVGDTEKSVLDAAAASGRSGGVVPSVVAEEVGKVSTQARYADYLRMLQGRQYLLGTGINVTQDIRNAALNRENAKNSYGLNATQLEMKKAAGLDEWNLTKANNVSEGLGSAAGSLMGIPDIMQTNQLLDLMKTGNSNSLMPTTYGGSSSGIKLGQISGSLGNSKDLLDKYSYMF